jgi:hypothetical protein
MPAKVTKKPPRRIRRSPSAQSTDLSRWILYHRMAGMSWNDILILYNQDTSGTPSRKLTSSQLYGKLSGPDRGLLRQRMFWNARPAPRNTPENFYWHERGLSGGSGIYSE